MENDETTLEEICNELSEVIKPYQQKHTQRQRMIDLVRKCIRSGGRDDFFQIDELLKAKVASEIEKEKPLKDCIPLFERLRTYADSKVDRYRIQFIDDLEQLAQDADLPMEIDFPRFSVLKGIDGEIEFATRKTIINKKPLKSIDPKRIVSAALKLKRQLYDRPFDPQEFIDRLFQVYKGILKSEKKTLGAPLHMQSFYLEFVLSFQSSVFFQDMDKGKFRGYSLEQFSVDIWRYFQAGIGGTSDGPVLQLRPGRNKSLWLIDTDGEKRQITTISFQEQS